MLSSAPSTRISTSPESTHEVVESWRLSPEAEAATAEGAEPRTCSSSGDQLKNTQLLIEYAPIGCNGNVSLLATGLEKLLFGAQSVIYLLTI